MADDFSYQDVEAEDAWDRDDPVEDQILNLRARALVLAPDVATNTLDEIADVARGALARERTDRGRLRAEQILEDIKIVRARL